MGASQNRPETQRRGRGTSRWKEDLDKVVKPGSELEWRIKEANSEDTWTEIGKEEGTYIWRIVKFKVTPWPEEDHGKFHKKDAYIVLHSHRIHDKTRVLTHDIHFWIGSESTHDKFGTAAYKTVELYNYLSGIGKQYREVEGAESKLFKSYFEGDITILEGGSEPGFKEVLPEEYKHRLLHFKGVPNKVTVKEVRLARSSLNSGDVFVLDLGLHIIQWNGRSSNGTEKFQAKAFVTAVRSDRGGRPNVETVEEGTESVTFNKILPGESGDIQSAGMAGEDNTVIPFKKQLYRITSARNGVKFKKIATGAFSRDLLDEENGYVVDTGLHVYFWVGRQASPQLKADGFAQAKIYVEKSEHPFLPLTRLDHINQADYSDFNEAFTAETNQRSCAIL